MSDSFQEQLQRALGDAYRLEREIGAGGMSTVFAAVETSLSRHVAIKVLKPELVAEISSERFAREVKLAASLQQANIVPLISAGTAGGFSYYTMPLVDGSTLRARLASGMPVPLAEAISILRTSLGRSRTRTAPAWFIATSSRTTSCCPAGPLS